MNENVKETPSIKLDNAVGVEFYLTAATRANDTIRPYITNIPLEDQIDPIRFKNSIKGKIIDTLIKPIKSNILLAIYLKDSTLTLNAPEKENKNFSNNVYAIVVAKADDVTDVEVGDVIIYEPSGGTRIPTKDIMDRKEINIALTGIKNRKYEELISGANRVNLRMFVLIKQHDITGIRYDA